MELEIDYQRDRRRKRRNRRIARILILLAEIAAVIGLAYVLMNVVLERVQVPKDSMANTLKAGDSILVNKFAYIKNGPSRGDVIVFKQSGREHDFFDIKRVIGLPGDTVKIYNGRVYINGERYTDPILCEDMIAAGLAKEPITLEENEYFVLGDNRNNSEDSRFANVGNIVREDIIGKAWITLSPFHFVEQLNRVKTDENKE